MAGRDTRLRWRKRRWHCDQPGCPRKSFTEQVTQVPARARITARLRQAAGAAVADGNRTIVQAARDLGMSWPIVAAAFTAHAAKVLPAEPEPVTVLGIDEVRRGKPCWSFDKSPSRGPRPSTGGTSGSAISAAGKDYSPRSKAAPARR
nr:helix-turn-helix domain-containing protein [Actinoplanes solisilvae]